MRHLYECPLRWADLDQLGHINNVVYVDYLQEARVDMLLTHAPDRRSDDLADGAVVVRHDVEYAAPLTLRPAPVKIETWVTEIRAASFTMAYEIFDETPEGRVVYLQATTVLTPYVFKTERPRRITPDERDSLLRFLNPVERVRPEKPAPARPAPHRHYPVQVRFSDVDVYGHVNNVKYFEYFQEARISYLSRLAESAGGLDDASVVIAHTEVDYKIPILFRPEPYDAWTWVSRVGNSSFVLESEIRDGDTVLSRCRVAVVTFDPETQRSRAPSAAYREMLLGELEG
ncbi:Thioesterase superfamily protein [metagenome]|uniref:Thioesterase superfamily protein n=1 Tax=metagenome TaxID=256318 RepID=A0A2P2C8C6_9ZZZZ